MKDYKKKYKEVIRDNFPENMTITFGDQKLEYQKKKWTFKNDETGLRYGDNPGQEAALYELTNGNLKLRDVQYVNPEDAVISNLRDETLTETGKHLGKSNLADVDAALNILKYFDEPTAIIVKHGNPSGVASRENIKDAYVAANFADRIAAFGGALVINKTACKETAEEILKNYLEVVAAPEFEKEAIEMLKTKKNMRLMSIKKLRSLQEYRNKKYIEFKSLMDGGIIIQNSADNHITEKNVENAETEHKNKNYKTERKATEKEIEDMLFGYKILQGVVSNSMLFAKNKTTIAICAGEQDRVGATEMAVMKSYKKVADRICYKKYGKALWEIEKDKTKQEELNKDIDKYCQEQRAGLKGSILASDGFLPFRDTVDVAAKQGATGIIQPGGSARDYQSIEACNEHKMSMVFTGKRVFRH